MIKILKWANGYLDFAKAEYAEKTFREKRNSFKRFINDTKVDEPGMITPEVAVYFLSGQFEKRSRYSANKTRSNLAMAWDWGQEYFDDFPQTANPFRAVDKFPDPKQLSVTQEDIRQAVESLSRRNRIKEGNIIFLSARDYNWQAKNL